MNKMEFDNIDSYLEECIASLNTELEECANTASAAQLKLVLSAIEKTPIDLESLRVICLRGVPSISPQLRALLYKLLLKFLSLEPSQWKEEVSHKRDMYNELKKSFIREPKLVKELRQKSIICLNDGQPLVPENMSCSNYGSVSEPNTSFLPSKTALDDHPLNPHASSEWRVYWKDVDLFEEINKDVFRTRPEISFFKAPINSNLSVKESNVVAEATEASAPNFCTSLEADFFSPSVLEKDSAAEASHKEANNQSRMKLKTSSLLSDLSRQRYQSVIFSNTEIADSEYAEGDDNAKDEAAKSEKVEVIEIPDKVEGCGSDSRIEESHKEEIEGAVEEDGLESIKTSADVVQKENSEMVVVEENDGNNLENETEVTIGMSIESAVLSEVSSDNNAAESGIYKNDYENDVALPRNPVSPSSSAMAAISNKPVPSTGSKLGAFSIVQTLPTYIEKLCNVEYPCTYLDLLCRILFIYAKAHPSVQYVQGMNELLAPLAVTFFTDPLSSSPFEAETITYFCFCELMAPQIDAFTKSKDIHPNGILARIAKLDALVRMKDITMWRHLRSVGINAEYYSLRWLLLYLTQEFKMPDLLILWDAILCDSLVKNPLLYYICYAMMKWLRNALVIGDFTTCMRMLQHLPDFDPNSLLSVALSTRLEDLMYEISSASLSLQPNVADNAALYMTDHSTRTFQNSRVSEHLDLPWYTYHGIPAVKTNVEVSTTLTASYLGSNKKASPNAVIRKNMSKGWGVLKGLSSRKIVQGIDKTKRNQRNDAAAEKAPSVPVVTVEFSKLNTNAESCRNPTIE